MLTTLSSPYAVTIPRYICNTYRRKLAYGRVVQQPRVSDKFVATVRFVTLPFHLFAIEFVRPSDATLPDA